MPALRVVPALVAALLAGPAQAHGITDTPVEAPAAVVRFAWATGGPVAAAGFRLWGPGDTEPWLIGRSDRDGRVAFVPDRAGPWRLELQADPEHKVTRTIEIGPDRPVPREGPWRRLGLVTAIAIAAVAGFLAGRRWPGRGVARGAAVPP